TRTTAQNISILQAYGARVEVIAEPDARTGDLLQARINHVNYLRRVIPNSWWVNQYANIYNAQAHHQTMREIASAFHNDVDYIFCAVSTYGTLRGCSEYIRRHSLKTRIIGVDAIGSVIFGGKAGRRMIPGHGASRLPELFQPDLVDQHYHISDEETVIACRRLLRREAILAGGSSGAVITAVEKTWDKIPTNATCVAILCDRGERYLDTIYSDAWVKRHFGDNATQIAGELTANQVPIS
ncbi:MAG TPA: pyridoxal-phosphate dependent enzyme, partial [Ktedonobacteraceae bacterium]|nr:pyridoxal-phosphate dependent enzyme [Ktedonobacteraceae bacterium]